MCGFVTTYQWFTNQPVGQVPERGEGFRIIASVGYFSDKMRLLLGSCPLGAQTCVGAHEKFVELVFRAWFVAEERAEDCTEETERNA